MNESVKCPICLDFLAAAHSTICGHSFCHSCIVGFLRINQRCPCCNTATTASEVQPNHPLERMVKKMRRSFDYDDEQSVAYSDDIDSSYIAGPQDEKYQSYLSSLLCVKRAKLEQLQDSIAVLTKSITKNSNQSVPVNHNVVMERGKELEELFDICVREKRDFRRLFGELSKRYSMQSINSIVFGDVLSPTNVVSSVEYNSNNGLFAVSGSHKQIRVYDYYQFSRPAPVVGRSQVSLANCQLTTPCKIAALAWDPNQHPEILASADYEGSIKLYDVSRETLCIQLDEHERRVWAIDYNKIDSNLLLSGSDDGRLKQWSVKEGISTFTIDAKANICTVQYHPEGDLIAFGAADHNIHVHDKRFYSKPVYSIKEHKKAVSYIRWIDKDVLLSASTDNTIKQWKGQECIKNHHGHLHEKNFVGMAVKDDWFICGSETNRVCLYSRYLETPICELPLGCRDPLSGQLMEADGFASSVTWVSECEILVGNSLGLVSAISINQRD